MGKKRRATATAGAVTRTPARSKSAAVVTRPLTKSKSVATITRAMAVAASNRAKAAAARKTSEADDIKRKASVGEILTGVRCVDEGFAKRIQKTINRKHQRDEIRKERNG